MANLKDLDGRLLKMLPDGSMETSLKLVSDADGVMFLCPKCFAKNNGKYGTHSVICWFVGKVGDDVTPKPGRWNPQGETLDDLTFVPPGAISVLLTNPDGCGWHGFVKDGKAD